MKVGDLVVVSGWMPPAKVERIEDDGIEVILYLDWGDRGKSRVKLHDQGKIWVKYKDLN